MPKDTLKCSELCRLKNVFQSPNPLTIYCITIPLILSKITPPMFDYGFTPLPLGNVCKSLKLCRLSDYQYFFANIY